MKKSTVKNVQPEQLLNSKQKTRNSTSPPAIANTGVVRSPKSRSNEFIFARKMYFCVQLLGGQSDILASIGSWRIDVSDEETFGLIDLWIDATIKEQSNSLEYIKEWHNK